jgi:hypothetical protein
VCKFYAAATLPYCSPTTPTPVPVPWVHPGTLGPRPAVDGGACTPHAAASAEPDGRVRSDVRVWTACEDYSCELISIKISRSNRRRAMRPQLLPSRPVRPVLSYRMLHAIRRIPPRYTRVHTVRTPSISFVCPSAHHGPATHRHHLTTILQIRLRTEQESEVEASRVSCAASRLWRGRRGRIRCLLCLG